MNQILKNFLLVGKSIGEQMIPGMAGVEAAISAIKSGGDKKAAVVEIVKSGLQATEALIDKDLVDDPLFAAGLSEVNDGYAKILKAIQARHVAPAGV